MAWSERDDWQIECWSRVGANAELRNDFRDWHADVPVIIDRQVRLRERMAWLYNYNATAIAIRGDAATAKQRHGWLARSLSLNLRRALLLGRPRLLGVVRVGSVASQPKRPQPRSLFAHGMHLGLVFGHCLLGLTQLLLLLEQRFGAAVRLIGIRAQYRNSLGKR
jgi:hypothetical protein